MSTPQSKNISVLAQSALKLDSDFTELERLAGELEHVVIESDSGFERAKRLLSQFAECGQRIGEGVQKLAKALEESRERAEKAANAVSTRTEQIQKRQAESEQMLERFRSLSERVRDVTATLGQLKKAPGEERTSEEKAALPGQLTDLDSRLASMADEAVKLREDAHTSNMKALERDANSMSQSLQSARQKLSVFADRTSERSAS